VRGSFDSQHSTAWFPNLWSSCRICSTLWKIK
jgi:hypothetical protein